MRAKVLWITGVGALLLGCPAGTNDRRAAPPPRGPAPTTVPASKPVAAGKRTPPRRPRPAPPTSPRPGDRCQRDDACRWLDPCALAQCVAARRAQTRPCDESRTTSARCRCVDRRCTAVLAASARGGASSTGGRCKSDHDCGVDRPTGRCVVDPGFGQPPPMAGGPFCRCERRSGRCQLLWFEPVDCQSWRDCWYQRKPVLHPVRAKPPRQRKVKPCRDSPVDVRCSEGHCRVVRYRC